MKYIIAAHVAYTIEKKDTFGPAHNVVDFLKKKNQEVVFVKHCLNGQMPSEVVAAEKIEKNDKYYNRGLAMKSFGEILINIKNTKGDNIVFVGVDPVNGLSGVLLKGLGRIKKFIYLTPDYIEGRFKNPLVNRLYHFIDRLCLRYSNEVWSVSSRIVKKRKTQGVPDSKNKLVPNSPDFDSIKRVEYNGNKDLIIVSPLSKTLNLKPVLEALNKLTSRYGDLKLRIIGSGDQEEVFKKMTEEMGLAGRVVFLGRKDHHEVLDILTTSFIGFALYTPGETNWNIYGDSMKAREYVACGLPVIINDIPSTVEDVKEYNAGLVLHDIDPQKMADFIEKCMNDREYYIQIRENAIRLGRDFDKSKILSELLGV